MCCFNLKDLMKNHILFCFFMLTTTLAAAQYAGTPDCLDSLKIPTAFSPNGDGVNDVFAIHFPCVPDKFELTILNRWGEEIFKSDDFTVGWNGMFKKKHPMPGETYRYVVTFTYLNIPHNLHGDVLLMR